MKSPILILCCAMVPALARAQSLADTSLDRSGSKATEFWAGYSPRSPKWGVLGNRPGMSFAIVAGRVTRRLKTTPRYALDYTLDIVPIAMSSPPLGSDANPVDTTTGGGIPVITGDCKVSVFGCRFPNGSAYGAGVSPLGVSVVYRRDRIFQPRIGVSGGFLQFDRKVPTIISNSFNFTAMIEAGAQILNHNGDGILVMYRFHHFSNAGIAEDNSALASHVISFGARVRTRGR